MTTFLLMKLVSLIIALDRLFAWNLVIYIYIPTQNNNFRNSFALGLLFCFRFRDLEIYPVTVHALISLLHLIPGS